MVVFSSETSERSHGDPVLESDVSYLDGAEKCSSHGGKISDDEGVCKRKVALDLADFWLER